ncbi:hypothetical protein FIBSPDRAFT_406380 [Athelia psychrophila]|uniref:Uncharacterized protein n=1 Tax=Athelia psychrophila TaxID=1759441 RepID=A0A166N8V9_9AGAM|nr:hypothetical protein FIBSPDRAFT_406380 [Fibularhizoctonia sp. CBS 109695]
MWNAFLIIRFVFFSAMVYMNLLSIIFASWNIGEVRAAGLSAPGESVFMIMTGLATFAFVAAGLAELVSATSRSANVAFECGWTAIFSVLQTGAAVAATVNGPPSQCLPNASWGVCASSFTLVPVSWLAAFIAIAYFLLLIGTAVSHMNVYPTIWWKTVYTVPWFVPPAPNPPPEPKPPTPAPNSDAASRKSRDSFMVVRYLRGRMPSKASDLEQPEEPILFPPQSSGLLPPPMPALPPAAVTNVHFPPEQARMSTASSSRRPQWAKHQASLSRRGRDPPFAPVAPVAMDDSGYAGTEEDSVQGTDAPSPPAVAIHTPPSMDSLGPEDRGYTEARAQVPPPPAAPPRPPSPPTPLMVTVARETSRHGRRAPIVSVPTDVDYSPMAYTPDGSEILSFPPPPLPPKGRPLADNGGEGDDGFYGAPRNLQRAPSISRRPSQQPRPMVVQKRSLHMPPHVPQFDTRPLALGRAQAPPINEDAPIPLGKRSDWVRADASRRPPYR